MKSYFDIRGDGGSGIVAQVRAQRQRIADNLAGVRRRVAVASGKGGVGKSTLTLQLARVLAAEGRRVAVFDADLNGPSQARLAGLRPAPPLPGTGGLVPARDRAGIGVVSLGSVVPEGRPVDFDSVSRGESHVWRATREFSAAGELLASVEWGELDLLLFDLPPGTERTFQWAEFLGSQTAFALVTLPSGLSRGVVARALTALRRTSNPLLGYIENMTGYYCEDCGTVKPLFPETAEVELDLRCLGRVPFDAALARAADRGESLDGRVARPATTAVRGVAERLIAALESRP